MFKRFLRLESFLKEFWSVDGSVRTKEGGGRRSRWWAEEGGGGGGGGVKLVALSHGMADLVSYGDAHRDIDQVTLYFYYDILVFISLKIFLTFFICLGTLKHSNADVVLEGKKLIFTRSLLQFDKALIKPSSFRALLEVIIGIDLS